MGCEKIWYGVCEVFLLESVKLKMFAQTRCHPERNEGSI